MEPGQTDLPGGAGKPGDYASESLAPAFLFDLDGTLVDSVYQHVLAWREALEQVGIELSVWRIHRRIGMSGGLFVNALLRETGREIKSNEAEQLRRLHAEAYNRQSKQVRPLPGARELLQHLSELKVKYAIATSGRLETAGPTLELLGLPSGIPVVTRDLVRYAKPDPHLFLDFHFTTTSRNGVGYAGTLDECTDSLRSPTRGSVSAASRSTRCRRPTGGGNPCDSVGRLYS